MELNKEFTRQRIIGVDGVQSAGDYTLSDYQGDVRKILFSSATLQDGGRYHNDDVLDCIGTVTYKIVYMDSEGKITPVSFSSEYELSLKCPAESYVDSDVRARITNFSLRLMGPRRFSAKCAIEAEVSVTERAEHRVEGEFDGVAIEARTSSVEVSTASYSATGEREFAEELVHLDGAIVDEVDVAVYSVEPVSLSATRADGGVSIKAQMCVRALVGVGGEMPHMYECSVDFSAIAPDENISEDAVLIPSVNVLSESVSTVPDEVGVSVVVNIIATAGVSAQYSTPVTLLKDCFSTERGIEGRESEFIYTEHVGTRAVCEKFSASYAREAVGAECVRNVLYEAAKLKIENTSPSDEGIDISGTVQVSAIACEVAEDGTPSYTPMRFEAPFVINVNIGGQIPQNSRQTVRLLVEHPHIDVDEESVKFGCNIAGSVSVYADRREPCIDAISLSDDSFTHDASVVSVYYPMAGESLFDVAKKFRKSPMSIAGLNELSEAACSFDGAALLSSGVNYLLIK